MNNNSRLRNSVRNVSVGLIVTVINTLVSLVFRAILRLHPVSDSVANNYTWDALAPRFLELYHKRLDNCGNNTSELSCM